MKHGNSPRKRRRRRRPSANKGWRELSKGIRARIGECEICGSPVRLQVHHLLPRKSHPALTFDEGNLICLCAKHHFLAHHGLGWELAAWLRKHKPEQFAHVMELAGQANGM